MVVDGFGSRGGQSGSSVLAGMIFDKDNPAGRKKDARSWSWMDGDGPEVHNAFNLAAKQARR